MALYQGTQTDLTAIDGGKVQVEYSGKPKPLSKHLIMLFFDAGVLKPASYAGMALWFENDDASMVDFNVQDFIERWETPGKDGGKPKVLTADQVMSAIATYQKVGIGQAEMPNLQMSLDFNVVI